MIQTHVEEYWFGFVVCNRQGVALSRAFPTLAEAEAFQREYREAV
jgi:hypothetical protein